MSVIQSTDIEGSGLSKLLPEFKNANKLRGLLASLLSVAQPTEDTTLQVMKETGIDTATGQQLDTIGKLLNISRGGRSDEDYRQALYVKVSINSANGTPESIITLVKLSTGSEDVSLTEYYPAEAHIQVTGGSDVPEGFLDLVSPAGVGTYLSIAPEGVQVWVPSEEGNEMAAGILPEEGNEAGFVILEDVN